AAIDAALKLPAGDRTPAAAPENPDRPADIGQDRLDHRAAARRAIAGEDADADRIDPPPAFGEIVEDGVRQGRNRAGPGHDRDAGPPRGGIEASDRTDELAAVGEVRVIDPRGNALLDQIGARALERTGTVDDEIEVAEFSGGHMVAVEQRHAAPAERRGKRVERLAPASAERHLHAAFARR